MSQFSVIENGKKMTYSSKATYDIVHSIKNNTNTVITKTKDTPFYGPLTKEQTSSKSWNDFVQTTKNNSINQNVASDIISGTMISQSLISKDIDKARIQSASVGGLALSGTAIPQKVVNATLNKLNAYGIDTSGYVSGLPAVNKTDTGFNNKEDILKDSSTIVYDNSRTDIFNKSTTTGSGQGTGIQSTPTNWLSDLLSGIDTTAEKYIKLALLGMGIFLGIKVVDAMK